MRRKQTEWDVQTHDCIDSLIEEECVPQLFNFEFACRHFERLALIILMVSVFLSQQACEKKPLTVLEPDHSVEIQKAASKAAATAFRDCADCPVMVVVPAGQFVMGEKPEKKTDLNHSPPHPVTIGKPFAVGQFVVTNREYALFWKQRTDEGIHYPFGCHFKIFADRDVGARRKLTI
jgi:formylglycine-generating enzyme required for sulfatase activity